MSTNRGKVYARDSSKFVKIRGRTFPSGFRRLNLMNTSKSNLEKVKPEDYRGESKKLPRGSVQSCFRARNEGFARKPVIESIENALEPNDYPVLHPDPQMRS